MRRRSSVIERDFFVLNLNNAAIAGHAIEDFAGVSVGVADNRERVASRCIGALTVLGHRELADFFYNSPYHVLDWQV